MLDFSGATLAARGAGGACGRQRARLAPRGGVRGAPEDPLPRAGTVRHVLHVSPHRMHHVLMLYHAQPLRALCASSPDRTEEREDQRGVRGRATGESLLR